MTIFLISSAAQ